ncbi:enoyl-CoA hydratase/isomerase family protein [Pseudomonas sp. TCU-HL1]|uniref:enoyl-CoA hydratase/isomerase family protein n=1 Tax=Pseudomonas sp. TCU-HL1 TaxID=1856685 RepID=UPI00083CBA0E|nr:enoyl-CoA hydratase/isomerase family protein [Pseudomonas sp. TCU-HL1]AOE88120.1 enoyl-CoA hydratase [Pseudomonas sp. TCU-HL1]
MSTVLYERQGSVGLVTLNRPERLNAISSAMLGDFERAMTEAINDADTAAIVLTGAGRAFCSGDDLKEFEQQSESEASVRAHIDAIQRITKLMLGSDKPVVGALHGYAVGGGFEWVLNCDLVVASENLIGFFPEMDWGNFVTGGVTYLLPQTLGYQRTFELIVLGERQSAARLQQLGLVNWVVPQEEMLTKAFEVAEKIASKSRASVARLKTLINQDLGGQLWRAVALEEQATVEAFMRPEAAERVKQFGRAKS